MPRGVARRVALRATRAMLGSIGGRRPPPGATMDLVLLAALSVTVLVGTLAAIWVVPLAVVAALAGAADDLA